MSAGTEFSAPVIIPRRDDPPQWQGAPSASWLLLNLTQQQEFAAGGQVPTKLWRWDHDSDVRTYNWPPQGSYVLVSLTQQKEFGQGGQVPTKLWRWDTDTDHRAYNWPPQASNILINLIQQKEFGQGGQVPTKLWRWDNVPDPVWQGAPVANPALSRITPFAKLWREDIDTSTAWTWAAPGANYNLLGNLLGGQVPTKFWRYDVDTSTAWTWSAPPSPQQTILAPSGSPFSKFWRYDWDSDTRWLGTPAAAPFNVLGGQVPTKFWRYDYDSGATQWTWSAPPSDTLSMLVEGGAPFHKLWRYDLDSDTRQWSWPAPPVSEPLIASAISPFFKLWRYDYSPEPYWPGYPLVSYPLTLTSTEQKFFGAPGQVPTKFWRYDLDTDTRQWTWGGTNLFIPNVPTGALFSKFWRYDYDSVTWWTGAPTANQSLLDITPFHKLWRYDYDSGAAVWQGAPVPNQSVLDITPFAKFWRYDLDTDTRWLGTPTGAPFNILGGKVPTKLWRWDNVPDPIYQWLPSISLSIRTVQPPTFLIPNTYRLWGNQGDLVPPTYWQGSPMPALVARYYGPLVLQPEMWAIGLARKTTGTGASRVMTSTGLLRRMFASGVARVLFATGAIRNLFVPGSKRSNE